MIPAARSLVEAAADIQQGRCTSVSLTEEAIARAESAQRRLNCFIRIDKESALAQAVRADQAMARGELLGPLHGVPLAHKDMFYEAGKVTNCASQVRKGFIPNTSSTILDRISSAGAVNIGTLNMTEFAFGPTGHNAVWGNCRNPWNIEHITCGSSSGSGASVAARVVYGALGSDSGGSVRLPAAANGLVGMKPTYSRVSRFGCMGLSFSIDTPGPLARNARDCARLLGVIAGADEKDPLTSKRLVPDYERATERGIEGLRIGIATNFFYDHATGEVRSAMEDSLAALERQGAKLVEVHVPDPSHLTELSRAIIYSEGTAKHGFWLRNRGAEYTPQIRIRASTGIGIPAPIYVEALQLRAPILRRFVSTVFSQCDVLHTPTLSIPVPRIDETDVGSSEAMWGLIAVLVHCTAPFNYLGLPALAVPVGFTRSGLPTSMQLIGRPFAEACLLQVAAAYERETDWTRREP